ncbi:MAG TPA: hypothetical protein DCY64_02235 [Hydrogenophaga sp.]|jgi:hypothetical protein|uniref:hypothetical protein n=1 Tax=Hydrogenophaga TaxID=47420 RepID=UPI0008AC932F|nr:MULTISPECIES: hypothetical protein [Hydrogenophaga]MBU4183844.1 hypothetical protein [Gammaproteobacteria bacterium]MBW8468234.1 hypothetical protein [Thiobacillus sp.]OGA79191.1 MAG: hypothetical protein A2X73_12875 [Burkholderiales bacterium GWE1_65_30]OGA92296.1 MAG: hypothetical protein A2X72_17980 [Burkholderiales bacterium GWF1_66_17]OGB35920.1 MAG: hypothetical protein A3I16_00640 [Burkholderiales bacterium RIFCSPLOWO2_02_FULL_66_35]OGB49478.1 MAG: hypothetical protein A3E51_03630 [
MSTIFSPSPASLGLPPTSSPDAAGTYRVRPSRDGARGLAALLLAAAVAALVVLADRLISTWADGHLFLAWVALWVVIFAGLALFAGTARNLAQRTLRSLDSWSATLAEARADMRLWEQARRDPRLMNELMQARMRDTDDGDFETALAPMGLEPGVVQKPVSGWGRFPERLAESRARNIHLYYI